MQSVAKTLPVLLAQTELQNTVDCLWSSCEKQGVSLSHVQSQSVDHCSLGGDCCTGDAFARHHRTLRYRSMSCSVDLFCCDVLITEMSYRYDTNIC